VKSEGRFTNCRRRREESLIPRFREKSKTPSRRLLQFPGRALRQSTDHRNRIDLDLICSGNDHLAGDAGCRSRRRELVR